MADHDATGEVFQPELPRPPAPESSTRKIVFSRPTSEVRLVAKSLLDDEDAPPGQVGESCFEVVLETIPRPKKKP